MKPHWSENAIWQFIGVVLSALGIFISLLPENQRLFGFLLAMIGVGILAWKLLRTPAKRITQELTRLQRTKPPRMMPDAPPNPTIRLRSVRARKDHIPNRVGTISASSIVRAKKDNQMYKRDLILQKMSALFTLFIYCAVFAISIGEVYLIWKYIDGIFPNHNTLSLNDITASSTYMKLWQAYTMLYNYAETSLILIFYAITMINIYIVELLSFIIRYLSRKIKMWIHHTLKGQS